MTRQPQPLPGEGKPAGQYLRQLRDLAAYVLVGATVVFLFVALLELIPGGAGDDFGGRATAGFGNFVNLVTIAFPVTAVLLALLVQPRHPKAQLIVLAALVEYAVMAFFGLLFGVLIGLINLAVDNGVRAAFSGLLVRLGWLAVFGVAAYAVYLIWRNLFYVAKPKQQPGVYGQPQFGAPGSVAGQAPPAAFPQQGGSPQPPSYAPGVYGQSHNPSWNQPATTMPAAGIAETQPVPQGIGYGPVPTRPVPGGPVSPVSAAPAGPEPTQVMPAAVGDPTATQVVPQSAPPATEATARVGEERPEPGPAGTGPRD